MPASAVLALYHDDARRLRAPPPWKSVSNLWPWPGMNARCPNTGVNNAYYLLGMWVGCRYQPKVNRTQCDEESVAYALTTEWPATIR